MLRVVPPQGGSEGYAQDGKVVSVSEERIVLEVQVDIPRKMEFHRKDGFDTAGIGSFLVRSPLAD